jgi:hypothetical protein
MSKHVGLLACCVLLIALLIAGDAQAASRACFSPSEIEADQAIRYHTELMVASETCKDRAYSDFNAHNSPSVVAYQENMKAHFRHSSRGGAESALQSYLTHLANEVALNAARQPADKFCSGEAALLQAAHTVGKEEFRRIVAQRAVDNKAAYAVCGSSTGKAKRSSKKE